MRPPTVWRPSPDAMWDNALVSPCHHTACAQRETASQTCRATIETVMDTTLRALESSWAKELRPTPLNYDAELECPSVSALRFVMGEPAWGEDTLTLTLWVENPTAETVTLGSSGFGLMPNHVGLQYTGPMMPPGPPTRVAIHIPPGSRVPYPRGFQLGHYNMDKPGWDYHWHFKDHRGLVLAHGTIALTAPVPPTPA